MNESNVSTVLDKIQKKYLKKFKTNHENTIIQLIELFKGYIPPFEVFGDDSKKTLLKDIEIELTELLKTEFTDSKDIRRAIEEILFGKLLLLLRPQQLINKINDLYANYNDSYSKNLLAKSIDKIKRSNNLLQEDKLLEIEFTIDQLNSRAEKISEESEKRYKEFYSKQQEDLKNRADTLQNNFNELENKAKERFEAFEKLAKDNGVIVENLAKIQADKTISLEFGKLSAEEKVAADFWRKMALLFIWVACAWLFLGSEVMLYFKGIGMKYAMEKQQNETVAPEAQNPLSPPVADGVESNLTAMSKDIKIDWRLLLISISLTGVLLYGAAYSANQSSRHRQYQWRYKKYELDLWALNPFLSPLTEEQQNQLRVEIAKYIFGHQDDDGKSKIMDDHAYGNLIQFLNDLFGKMKPKG